MGAGPLLTVSGGERVRLPAQAGGNDACAPSCPSCWWSQLPGTVTGKRGTWWPYFLITFLAGPWELVARGAVGLTHAWVTWWRGEAAWSGVPLAREQVRMERD